MSTAKQRKEIYCTHRWRRLRRAKIQAANFLCQQCGKAVPDSYFELHHKIPVEQCDDPFEHSNLIVICRTCHRTEHSKQERPDKQAWNDYLLTSLTSNKEAEIL